MFGGFLNNLFWGFTMLLYMLIPIIIIILSVTMGMVIWHRMKKKGTYKNETVQL